MNRLRAEISESEKLEVQGELEKFRFFHRFEIFRGVYTPGQLQTDPFRILQNSAVALDLQGSATLDVGCMEGSLAFEFEQRGAKSYAIDIHDPDEVAFNLCRRLLQSKVIHHRDTVYNLPAIFDPGSFDIVAFRGVYYHLKNPIGALEAIARILKSGGKMLISGECLITELFDLDGVRRDAGPISQSELAGVPLSACYPGAIEGMPSSIWFVPNLACIRSWLTATGFELKSHTISEYSKAKIRISGVDRALQRFEGVAIKVRDTLGLEHPVWRWRSGG